MIAKLSPSPLRVAAKQPEATLCRLLLLVAVLAISPGVGAQAGAVDELLERADQQQTWQNDQWLNLLHYYGAGDSPGAYQSDVKDPRFFLSPDGRNNPESELLATISAFYKTDTPGDDHAQCRFVARLTWLTTALSIDPKSLPVVHCSKYREWREHVRSGQITLVFPAYHLNSPSSMFGHTLLRLDSAEDEGDTRWLSTAVNFGANVTEDDNSILYAYKGLVGGYAGRFVIDHYYKKIQEYDRIEHRDIWEYRLNLTPDEIEILVEHLWEVRDIDFDYYYFDENCSYRLLELLEIARPGIDLTAQFRFTAIPVDTVRAIDGAGMIESDSYRPSQLTRLRHALLQVPVEDQALIIGLSRDITVAETAAFTTLSTERQRAIVDIAYEYLRYQQSGEARDPEAAKRSHRLLLLLNSYPRESASEKAVATPGAPNRGHRSQRVTFGLGERLDNYYAELGLKLSFHDLEDNEYGFLRGAQINIGTVQIRAEENESVRLYRLDLVDIFSITPRDRFFKPLSWKVYTGLERQLTKGVDQLTFHLTGGAGGSWQLLENNQVYALATGRLEVNKQLERAIEPAIGFSSGLLMHFGPGTARLDFSGEQFLDDVYRLRAGYIQNFVIATNHSLRLSASYEWQEADELSDVAINYQYYF